MRERKEDSKEGRDMGLEGGREIGKNKYIER